MGKFIIVSNLPFLSKILEKQVDNYFTSYDEKHGLGDNFQTAYTKNCFTETALLTVMNDLLTPLDGKKAMVLYSIHPLDHLAQVKYHCFMVCLRDPYSEQRHLKDTALRCLT